MRMYKYFVFKQTDALILLFLFLITEKVYKYIFVAANMSIQFCLNSLEYLIFLITFKYMKESIDNK